MHKYNFTHCMKNLILLTFSKYFPYSLKNVFFSGIFHIHDLDSYSLVSNLLYLIKNA